MVPVKRFELPHALRRAAFLRYLNSLHSKPSNRHVKIKGLAADCQTCVGAGGRRRRWCRQIGPTSLEGERVSPTGIAQLVVASAMFLAAAATAKHYALAPSLLRMAATYSLYTIGNLIMLRLVRDHGLGVSMSVSAVLQLVAINVVAFAFFGERLMTVAGDRHRPRNRFARADPARTAPHLTIVAALPGNRSLQAFLDDRSDDAGRSY